MKKLSIIFLSAAVAHVQPRFADPFASFGQQLDETWNCMASKMSSQVKQFSDEASKVFASSSLTCQLANGGLTVKNDHFFAVGGVVDDKYYIEIKFDEAVNHNTVAISTTKENDKIMFSIKGKKNYYSNAAENEEVGDTKLVPGCKFLSKQVVDFADNILVSATLADKKQMVHDSVKMEFVKTDDSFKEVYRITMDLKSQEKMLVENSKVLKVAK